MKRHYTYCVCFLLLTAFYITLPAQNLPKPNQPFLLGDTQKFLKQLNQRSTKSSSREKYTCVALQLSKAKTLKGKINFKRSTQADQYISGEIENIPASSFYLRINGKSTEGHIILPRSKKAYNYSSDTKGNTYISEIDINKLICTDYNSANAKNQSKRVEATQAIPNLQSFPGARGCVLLDFDGEYVPEGSLWNAGNPIDALPSSLSGAEIQEAWEIASEDFRPFHINITTDETVFNTYPKNRRMRCIITPTNTASVGSGGVAFVGSFFWTDDTPCWVFNNGAKNAGETISHEVGHTLGLSHDGRTSPVEEYFYGHGNWAPIMGASFFKGVTQWSKGEYAYSNNPQDDCSKLASIIGYREDDHGNTLVSATVLKVDASANVSPSQNFGIIDRASDIDMFSFSTGGGNITLNVNPAERHGDLDIAVTLYNSSGGMISTYNPSGLSASLNVVLSVGTYYLKIDGVGEGSPAASGYSDYSSTGYFSISGTIPPANQLPAVSLVSPAQGATVILPESVDIAAYASDVDGSISKVEFFYGSTKIGEDATVPYSFSWKNEAIGTYIISAKATDDKGGQESSSSITIEVRPNTGVTVFGLCDYGDYSVDLPAGYYTSEALSAKGISDNDISSLKIKSGYEVVLYQENNFQGSWSLLRGEFPCLTSVATGNKIINLNDRVSSLIVRLSTTMDAFSVEYHDRSEAIKLISISPNSFTDNISVHFDRTITEIVDLRLFTIQKKLVFSQPKVRSDERINLPLLVSGCYFIEINTGKELIIKRIVKD